MFWLAVGWGTPSATGGKADVLTTWSSHIEATYFFKVSRRMPLLFRYKEVFYNVNNHGSEDLIIYTGPPNLRGMGLHRV